MVLRDLIRVLKQERPDKIVPLGFHAPHSYRGIYAELAFEPKEGTTVGEMLACAEQALNTTYTGYKGGEYTMGEFTECNLAYYGDCGESIGTFLLDYMVGKY